MPTEFMENCCSKTGQIDFAEALNDLRIPPSNRLEALKGDRQGQYSIRINEQYRICFVWAEAGPENLEAGRLDALLAEVDKEYEAGLGQPL